VLRRPAKPPPRVAEIVHLGSGDGRRRRARSAGEAAESWPAQGIRSAAIRLDARVHSCTAHRARGGGGA
jgi:hypothetical protein